MNRDAMLDRLNDARERWDILIVGGGATGLGVAVDSASRGYRTVLVEQADFGKGTSSRSTKLVHGGVRYLQRGNLRPVIIALRERGMLLKRAPHLVSDLRFIVPNYAWWEGPFYGIGLRLYDMLAGRYGFGPSRNLSAEETLAALPTLRTEGLRGGVQYFDGQFDDTRLLVNLAQTAVEQGAIVANYIRVDRLVKNDSGQIQGAITHDLESGHERTIHARAVINATGPFSDTLRLKDDAHAQPLIAPSQGAHVVLPSRFLPGDSAIMVPHSDLGRVMFAIPWHDHVVVGTTDHPVREVVLEPRPLPEEVDFILGIAGDYLAHPASRSDVLSAWAGIRPLVSTRRGVHTMAISRDHHLEVSRSGLVTITGGKWTTYRMMAEDAVDQAAIVGGLSERACVTPELALHAPRYVDESGDGLAIYGSDATGVRVLGLENTALARRLHANLPITGAQAVWAAREEMARTVEDVLARRTRALFLDAESALAMAPDVAELLSRELGRDAAWRDEQLAEFRRVAQGFLVR